MQTIKDSGIPIAVILALQTASSLIAEFEGNPNVAQNGLLEAGLIVLDSIAYTPMGDTEIDSREVLAESVKILKEYTKQFKCN